jgi:hypothetical protein
VILRPDGVSDFDALHDRRPDREVQPLAFDLLELDGENLRPDPLERRKAGPAKLRRSRTSVSGCSAGLLHLSLELGNLTTFARERRGIAELVGPLIDFSYDKHAIVWAPRHSSVSAKAAGPARKYCDWRRGGKAMTRSASSARPRRYTIGERLQQRDVVLVLQRALAGGQDLPANGRQGRSVLWDDAGDQALLHLDSLVVKLIKRFVVVSLELETDQSGRAPLIVTIALGSTQDGAGLIGTSDEQVRGHPLLAARWGSILRQTIWAALLGTARQYAEERGKVPTSLHVLDGHIRIDAEPALDLRASAVDSFRRANAQRRPATR